MALHAAPTPPDAGGILRNTPDKPAEKKTDPEILPLEKQNRRESKPASPGSKFQLKGFRITGNTAIPTGELHPLIATHEGGEASLEVLRSAADKITDHYRSHGYILARAYLPAQDINDGIVEIAVLEGRYGDVLVRNESLVDSEIVKAQLAAVKSGDAVTARQLERAILLLNDRSGATGKASLSPGASVGTSDLVVAVESTQRVTADVSADNYGNRYSGEWRGMANVAVNSPLNRGDRLDFTGLFGSQVTDWDARQAYGRIAYQTPVGVEGTTVGGFYSFMGYHLGREFEALDSSGTAQNAGVFAGQSLIRSRALNLSAQLGYESKWLDDRTRTTGISSDRRLNNLTLGLSCDRSDTTGITVATLSFTGGVLEIADEDTAAADALSARTEGAFSALRGSLRRVQRLSGPVGLYISGEGQLATDNLTSAEKMNIGGVYGVRAYPQGEAAGDDAALITVELRYDFATNWRVIAFYDGAWSKNNHSPFSPGSNERYLGGPGIGLNWTPSSWSFKAEVALPTDGPAQSEPASDARFWLRATKQLY